MAKATGYRLLLVRAGSTEWDEAQRLQGGVDLPITESGRASAESVAAALGHPPATVTLSGPDEASLQTAGILAGVVKGSGKNRVQSVPDLQDQHLGLWEGMTLPELHGKCARAAAAWRNDPATVMPPQGEAFERFETRILSAVSESLGKLRLGATVILVLRGMAFGLVHCRLTGRSTDSLWTGVEGDRVTEWIEVEKDDSRLEPVLAAARQSANAA